jgi:hypothetical protein
LPFCIFFYKQFYKAEVWQNKAARQLTSKESWCSELSSNCIQQEQAAVSHIQHWLFTFFIPLIIFP